MTLTLEELREERIISNTEGRPVSYLTDEKWQEEFKVRKALTEPYGENMKKFSVAKFRESKDKPYHGQTTYQTYCTYMNNVLANIRNGETDYCYYIYQILDLLKFHKDELRTKYYKYGRYWAVWLER